QFNWLKVHYSDTLVASSAVAKISPVEVKILKETNFNYDLDLKFDPGDLGVDTLVVFTASPASAVKVYQNGTQIFNFENLTTIDRIIIRFDDPLDFNDMGQDTVLTLSLNFNSTLFSSVNPFPSMIISEFHPNNPQLVNESDERWTIMTRGIPSGTLVKVTAIPNPFSPNGDGVFDYTNIKFFAAKLTLPRRISVKIYNLEGDLIKVLIDESNPARPYNVSWNGTDRNGNLVRPGIYIYQVRVHTDLGDEVVTKTVTVAY
ncbi:MAG: gliding motility-associated C-terminal domain-containing protein, partial [Fidelibacterota bacterium]